LLTTSPEIWKFVGKVPPLPTLKGKPLDHLKIPEICQPPIKSSIKRFELLPNLFPFPKGRSATQFELMA